MAAFNGIDNNYQCQMLVKVLAGVNEKGVFFVGSTV